MRDSIEGTYIYFDRVKGLKKKTETWQVMSKKGIFLGDIKWFTNWREYAFFPEEKTIYEDVCLNEIANHIVCLMARRKQLKREEK